ncbi:MAG TPA: ABC transporter substrate-binding protein [Holophagaceae bacterium]|nr:ABC transporter substrate-binding protein [Holophagaceae bacterium]
MFRALLTLCLALSLHGQIVQDSFAVDPGPLDFIHGEGAEQAVLQSLAGDTLVGLRADGSPAPRLALRWKAVPGGLQLELRGDARFSDGSVLRAEDVRWTYEQLQKDPKASPTRKALLADVEVSLVEGGLRLRSAKPVGRLLLELARVPIGKKEHPEIGSGPFALERRGGEWDLLRRAHFLHPKLEGFHLRLLPDSNGILQALQKGWLSLGVPPPRAGLSPPAGYTRIIQPLNAQLIVWSRTDPGALQALERWRRDAFPPRLMGDGIRPSRGLWPETLGFPAMNIQGAAQPCPKDLELLYAASDAPVERLLLALAERARQDGVALHLKPIEAGLLIDRLTKGDFQLICAFNTFDPGPWSVLGYMEPGGELNFTGWQDAGLAALLPKLESPQSSAWKAAQSLWAQHPAALPLLDYRSVLWVDRRLHLTPSAMGIYATTPGPAGWTWTP